MSLTELISKVSIFIPPVMLMLGVAKQITVLLAAWRTGKNIEAEKDETMQRKAVIKAEHDMQKFLADNREEVQVALREHDKKLDQLLLLLASKEDRDHK